MRRIFVATLLALAALPHAQAQSGSEAEKALASAPFTIVAPFPPGGPVDTLARMLSTGLGERYKQPAVVENRRPTATSASRRCATPSRTATRCWWCRRAT